MTCWEIVLKSDVTGPDSQDAPSNLSQSPPPLKPPIAVHPASLYILLPSSHPSSLQIYSPHSSSLVCEIEVSPTNRVTGPNSPSPMAPVTVTHATTSSLGDWLATIDVRKATSDFDHDVVMKLWRWTPQQNTYTLNTRVDRPHGKSAVGLLLFSPLTRGSPPVLASGGEDDNLKLWGIRSVGKSKTGSLEGKQIYQIPEIRRNLNLK